MARVRVSVIVWWWLAAVVVAVCSHATVSVTGLSCDELAVASCWCELKADGSSTGLELMCPNSFVEVHNITLIAYTYPANSAATTPSASAGTSAAFQLHVKCNPYESREMEWRLLKGFDLSATEGPVKLKISMCPVHNNQTLGDFVDSIGIQRDRIITFSFQPQKTQSFASIVPFIASLSGLEVLDLQRNNLDSIPPLLTSLPRLKELHLRQNSITALQPADFQSSSSSLTLLDLSFNQIRLINTTFPSTLQLLDLSANKIEAVDASTLANLPNLLILTLRQNPLTSIHHNALDGLVALQTLDLDYTLFSALPDLGSLSHLQKLFVSYRDVNPAIFLNHSQVPVPNSGLEGSLYAGHANSGAELSTLFSAPASAFANLSQSLHTLLLISDALIRVPLFTLSPNLTVLNLSANLLSDIPPDAFANLPSLAQLDLSLNQIVTLAPGTAAPALVSLNLNNNFLAGLGKDVFSRLPNLESLALRANRIQTIDGKAFVSLTRLRELDLGGNQLRSLSTSTGMKIDPDGHGHGDMGIVLDSGFEQSALRFCTRLEVLNLAKNQIPHLYDDWKLLFLKLKSLDLSFNALTELSANDLNFLTARPLTIDLTFNNISTVNMDHAVLLLDGARNMLVKLNGNPLDCDCHVLSFHSFHVQGIHLDTTQLKCAQPPTLNNTLFSSVQPSDLVCGSQHGCPSICDCWKIPFNRTLVVDCSFRNLRNFIPSLHELQTPKGYRIVLNLAGNGLTNLNSNHTKNISSGVVEIDLSENELDSVSFLKLLDGAEGGLNASMLFTLAQNKFSCADCEFHRLIKHYFKQIADYKQLTCILDNNNATINSVDVEDLCSNALLSAGLLSLAIIAGILFALTGVLIAIYLKHGWAIRAFLYSKGLGSCFFVSDDEEESKVYDAFVSYSHKDEPWVISQLVNRLEEEEGFKLCLHYRDWTPGDWIPDQIVQSVDQSRRTVIILSKNFVESIWSRLEFKAAHSQALNDKTNRLILILVGDDLSETDIYDDDLRMYMKMNTYLKWSDPWLWHKLKFALPHKKRAAALPVHNVKEQHERAIQLDKLRTKMEQHNDSIT